MRPDTETPQQTKACSVRSLFEGNKADRREPSRQKGIGQNRPDHWHGIISHGVTCSKAKMAVRPRGQVLLTFAADGSLRSALLRRKGQQHLASEINSKFRLSLSRNVPGAISWRV